MATIAGTSCRISRPVTPPTSKAPSSDLPSSPAAAARGKLEVERSLKRRSSPSESDDEERPSKRCSLSSNDEEEAYIAKHRSALCLPSDMPTAPRASKSAKKVFSKKVLTTVSAVREKDIEDLHILRMLQLARASRKAFAANARYRLLRIHEIDVMHTVAHDEYEEANDLLGNADQQIGELRHLLVARGTDIATLSSVNLMPAPLCPSDPESSLCTPSPESSPPAAR